MFEHSSGNSNNNNSPAQLGKYTHRRKSKCTNIYFACGKIHEGVFRLYFIDDDATGTADCASTISATTFTIAKSLNRRDNVFSGNRK